MQTTKNYSVFKPHPANREIVPNLIQKLTPSLKQHGWIEGRPLLVNINGEVLDGAHRLEVAKLFNLTVPYVTLEGDDEAQIIALNANQSPWKILDFIRSYAVQGNDQYRKLLKFEEKYQFGITNSVDIFILDNIKVNNVLRAGEAFAENPDADSIAAYLLQCEGRIPFYKAAKFVRAIVFIFKKLNPNQRRELLDNIIKVPVCASTAEYLLVFQNILNGKRKTGKIKLEMTKKIAQNR